MCFCVIVFCASGDLAQDDSSSFKEVTLKDMASDEQYNPSTVYGEMIIITPNTSLVIVSSMCWMSLY